MPASKRYILVPILLVSLYFAAQILTQRTIIPLDIYLITPQLYQSGNALKVHNSYMTDTVEVYFPWKYYMSQYSPPPCETTIQNSFLGASSVRGLMLPGGYCYPMGAVRPAMLSDSFLLWNKILPFFAAYDLSFLFLMIAIFLSFSFLFSVMGKKDFSSVLCAALAMTSFPVARELQHDWVIMAMPFLITSLAFYALGINQKKISFLILSFFLLYISLTRSTLQALGFNFLFYFLFAVLWAPKTNKKNLWMIGGLLGLTVTAGLAWNFSSIKLFLNDLPHFVPHREIPLVLSLFKRTGAWVLSFIHSLFGGLIFSFDTVDFYKSLGNLGARDYPSYDGSSFFINPFVTIFVLSLFTGTIKISLSQNQKRSLKIFALACVADYFVIMTPLYKLLYFRFHQWWMLLSGLLLLQSILSENVEMKINKKRGVGLVAGLSMFFIGSYFFIYAMKPLLLAKLSGQGVLGFENGFWDVRLDKWLKRILLSDMYSEIWILSAFLGIYLYMKKKWNSLLVAITLAGLFLTTFHFNRAQKIEIFENYKAALSIKGWSLEGPGRPLHENVLLMLNKPVNQIYESLSVDMSKERTQ